MKIDEALLKKLEKLSYVNISDEKRAEVIAQLSEILSFVDNLSELDTSGVDDTFSMRGESTRLRDDEPKIDRDINENIIKNAPKSENHFFVVPKIIE